MEVDRRLAGLAAEELAVAERAVEAAVGQEPCDGEVIIEIELPESAPPATRIFPSAGEPRALALDPLKSMVRLPSPSKVLSGEPLASSARSPCGHRTEIHSANAATRILPLGWIATALAKSPSAPPKSVRTNPPPPNVRSIVRWR
jgi:hypothetical protein